MTMLFRFAIGLLFAIGLANPAWSALDHVHASIQAIWKAYGFILGQEAGLARIEREYTEKAAYVEHARLSFNSTFPDIKKRLEAELLSTTTQAKLDEGRAEIGEKIRQLFRMQPLTPKVADDFIAEVNARARGDAIEPDVLRYLLAVRYADFPVAEFADGFRQRFRTDGSGKAQGVRLSLQLPRSWLEKEADRPHIVKKWINQGGSGSTMIMLEIHNLGGYNPTNDEVKEFANSAELKTAVPEGGTLLNGGYFRHEGRPGYWMKFAQDYERATMSMYGQSYIYKLFLNGMDISLSCGSISTKTEKSKVESAIKLNEPVCRQVLNSLVFDQLYK